VTTQALSFVSMVGWEKTAIRPCAIQIVVVGGLVWPLILVVVTWGITADTASIAFEDQDANMEPVKKVSSATVKKAGRESSALNLFVPRGVTAIMVPASFLVIATADEVALDKTVQNVLQCQSVCMAPASSRSTACA